MPELRLLGKVLTRLCILRTSMKQRRRRSSGASPLFFLLSCWLFCHNCFAWPSRDDSVFNSFKDRGLMPSLRLGGFCLIKHIDVMDTAVLERLNQLFETRQFQGLDDSTYQAGYYFKIGFVWKTRQFSI